MRAIRFHTTGDARSVLVLDEVPAPRATDGHLVVAVAARPINPSDFFFINGRYRIRPELPQIAGLEGAGVVTDAGAGGEDLVGKRVAFRAPGAWAERVAVPRGAAHVVPDGIDFERAAQFSLNPITAWALLDEIEAHAGDWIALTAGRSAVSRIVAALARERGIHVVAVVRGAAEERADGFALVGDDARLATVVRDVTGGRGIVAALDSVGGRVAEELFTLLAPGATVVAYGASDNAPVAMRNSTLVYSNLTWKGFGIDRWLARAGDKIARMREDLWERIASGAIALPVDSRHPLADFRRAVARAADGAPNGKVMLVDEVSAGGRG